jgi:transcriptional regulator with XRE-family HTH domain
MEPQMSNDEKFDPQRLGEFLYSLRLKQNLSIAQVAKRLGYSKEFMTELEKDASHISIPLFLTLLDAMEYDWLIVPKPKKLKEQLKESVKNERKARK